MSFGFLTESALLPSKSKPIKVDNRSLVDLKAVVYAKEQKAKLDGRGGSSSGGLRGLRGKRAASADAGIAARKDPFAKSNRGVEDRSQRDEIERITASRKKKASERTLAAKSKLYEKMAKGEVAAASQAGSLVDFSRKTGADLALLEAKAGKPKRRGSRKRRRSSSNSGGGGSKPDTDDEDEDDEDDESYYGSAEISITDEFGRDRTVARGGPEHRAYLEAKKEVAEKEAHQKAEAEAYDERYSYRGNKGPVAPPSSAPAGEASASSGGAWAWSSGVGRGADEGEFETREGQERRAKKELAELLGKETEGVLGKDVGGAKIRSQWEKTLSGDQKAFLHEVHEETEAGRKKSQTDRGKQRAERKELLRQKQEARAARLRGGNP